MRVRPVVPADLTVGAAKPRYVPPTGDEPLDDNEWAFVRALVRIIVRELREEVRGTARPVALVDEATDAAEETQCRGR
jgi:hypothetical protein